MNRKVERALRAMTTPGDHVICAVSGGKDSMALLHVLWSLGPNLGLRVTCAHMNHLLRGAESQRDADFVRDVCQRWGIPLETAEADVAGYAQAHHMGLEEAARTLRYDFLLKLDPRAKVATAHTAGDNLETVLMHLLRGSGLHGLTGIPPVRGQIIRPLLAVSREEISAYLQANHIPHVEDSTNALDNCQRNRIRHHVLPLLAAENPNLAETVTRLTQVLRQEDEFLEQCAQEALDSAGKDGVLPLAVLLCQPQALQYRMLRRFLASVPELSARHLDAAAALCRSETPSARCDLPGGYTLARIYDALALLPPRDAVPTPEPIVLTPGAYSFGPWLVTCREGPAPASLPRDTLALDRRSMPGTLTLRTRLPGDKITLSGGTKKLSRLLIDLKIPAHQRDMLPVVSTEDTVLAVLPWKCAAPCRARVGSDSLILTATRMEDVK